MIHKIRINGEKSKFAVFGVLYPDTFNEAELFRYYYTFAEAEAYLEGLRDMSSDDSDYKLLGFFEFNSKFDFESVHFNVEVIGIALDEFTTI